MSRERDPSRIDTAFKVKHGDAECFVRSPEEIFTPDDPGMTAIYNETFVNSPVEQVTLFTEQRTINGDQTLVYSGALVLNTDIVDFDSNELVDDFMDLIMPSAEMENFVAEMKIHRTEIDEVARITDSKRLDFLVKVQTTGDKSVIFFGNYADDTKDDVTEVVFPIINDKDPGHQFESFLKIFMYLMKKSRDLTYEEQDQEISAEFPPKLYEIQIQKQELEPSIDIPKEVGSLALEKKKIRTHLIDGKFELEVPRHNLEQMGGMSAQLEDIEEIILGLKEADRFIESGINPAQAIMIYGEPGTGKTMLAHAIAHEAGAKVVNVQSTDLRDKYVGDSAKKTKQFFEAVKSYQDGKLVVILDEFDSTVIESGYGEDKAVIGTFKQEMNDFSNPNVLLVAITDNEGNVNSALVRSGRFGKKIYMKMPNETALTDIALKSIASYGKSENNPFEGNGDPYELLELMANAEGLTAADIGEVLSRLVKSRKVQEIKTGEDQPEITSADIKRAIEDLRQS